MEVLNQIRNIDQIICENIDNNLILNDRGFISQNILSQLRNLIEHCSLCMNLYQNKAQDSNISLEKVKEEIPSIVRKTSNQNKDFRFIKKFHDLLQITESHYAHDKNNSERLMLKYYEYLLLLKKLCKNNLNLNILNNLHNFPLELDKNLDEYYEKILLELNKFEDFRLDSNNKKNRYYVWRVKPVFIKEEIIYEITLTNATDNVSKFSRIVAFSKARINDNYAIKAKLNKTAVSIQNKYMPIFIISEIETSIRPCEFENFAKIFIRNSNKFGSSAETQRINDYITKNGCNLVDIIGFNDGQYNEFKQEIGIGNIQIIFLRTLDRCREICLNNKSGANILKYLLYKMNNKIIKDQILKPKFGYEYKLNDKLSNLYLKYESIPFDDMPFVSSPCGHNPKISDLLECIEYKDREYEFLARTIIQNTENNGILYTKQNELSNFSDLSELTKKFNNLLYYKHKDREICKWQDNYYIESYEKDIIYILKQLKELSKQGSNEYEEFANAWLESNKNLIDDDTKIDIIKKLFTKSKVVFIYGAAGTGKSTLANHISNLYKNKKQIFLAQTNPAIENIKSKVQNANYSNTYTISKIINSKQDFEVDLLFIDECSTVSNASMVKILNKVKFKRLILIGDIYQIEAIQYGTWFDIARSFLPPKHCQFELTTPYRTDDEDLLRFWECVRNFKVEDNTICEFGTWGRYFLNLDEKNDEIFHKQHDDEIVLCLNYDGLYGVNNINKFLQITNKNNPFEIGNFEFKIGDPILFVDNNFFIADLHNNLKGKIIEIIDKSESAELYFKIEVNKIFDDNHNFTHGLELISKTHDKTIVGFSVDKNINTDNDNAQDKLPFMLAYAVSIHKSQGLEYESVKIVVTREMEENITHSIFYTAITRAKKYLKIYWSPETQRHVVKNFNIKNNKIDVSILKAKEQI